MPEPDDSFDDITRFMLRIQELEAKEALKRSKEERPLGQMMSQLRYDLETWQ